MKRICSLVAFIMLFMLSSGCSSQQTLNNHKPIFKLDKSGNYAGFSHLPTDYTPKEALEDGCFVVVEDSETYKAKLYGGNEYWEAFLKASSKGEGSALRVVTFLSEGIYYDDLYYSNGYYHHFYYYKNSSSDTQPDTPYLYLRALSSNPQNPSDGSTIYVLTNNLELTYKDVIGTMASSSLEVIKKRDFDWLWFIGITEANTDNTITGINSNLSKQFPCAEKNCRLIL